MANNARGEVTLELEGEAYVLRPEFGVIAEIEDKLGISMFAAGRKLEAFDITAVALLEYIHAFLGANGHEPEPEALKEAVATDGAFKVVNALAEYCRAYAFGGQEKKVDADEPELETAAAAAVRETPPTST